MPNKSKPPIYIGLTERHGIAQEYCQFAPEGYEYRFIDRSPHLSDKIVSSSAKGFYAFFDDPSVSIVEAPIFPVNTQKNWIYTPAEFTATANFGIFGLPLPRSLRLLAVENVLKKDNFKKLIFKSHAGLSTLKKYAKNVDPIIVDKCEVIYPCVNITKVEKKFSEEQFNILFVGDFFRKGGANVVDVFEQLHSKYPHIRLNIIGNTQFDTTNTALANIYRNKIANHSAIVHKKVKRPELLTDIYPKADVLVSPTYQETFGFAILEGMAFGLPVISCSHFAIPEIIEDEQSGLLIETEQFEFISQFKGYSIKNIPTDFHQYMNEQLYERLERLVTNHRLCKSLSNNALKQCHKKFSPQIRANRMKSIYDEIMF
ncbi:glycosyltransferase family 4 protein [uncultured Paraglaciecola sp.]|uniref:glycosyltransferase family 4 protein n=1 Tax=uncultured Paraglaciecola sp. TaxID=1765024 RepID=UPI0030D8C2F2|tara:strand:- start:85674 stop:86789 length:1116 start_codon:yes stop_codon:yes gene_type:complete